MKEKVILAQNGSKEAFSDLVNAYKIDLYKIAKTRLHSEEDISDAIQETILGAYQAIHKLRKPEDFKKWLIKILINQCNDMYRKKRKNPHISLENVKEEIVSFHPKELETMEIEDLLKNLKEDEKLIITLYYLENYTSKEISQILQINENTIKTKIARAKAKIKNNIGGGIYKWIN